MPQSKLKEPNAGPVTIMEAINNRNITAVQQHIQQGVDINKPAIGSRKTPLHLAVQHQLNDIVALLINANANVNSMAKSKTTPLHIAAQAGNCVILRLLLDSGATIDAQNSTGHTALHEAAANNHQQAAALLVKRGAIANLKEYKFQLTPTQLARQSKHHNLANYLANIEKTKNLLNKIHINQNMAKKAVKKVAAASNKFSPELANNFINAVVANAKNTILDCIKKDVDVNMLISKSIYNTGNYTPYFNSYSQPANSYRSFFNQHAAEYASGYTTALHIAVEKKYKDTVITLLEAKADVNIKTSDGLTPLMLATYNNQLDIVKLLLTNNADPNMESLDGSTALHFACYEGFDGIAEELLRHKANVNNSDNDGETPLIVAIGRGKINMVNLLLAHKADVNKAKPNGVGPLFSAAQKGSVELTCILLAAGANVKAIRLTDYCSPLHVAAECGYLALAQCLINAGADISQRLKNNCTAIDIARAAGHVNVVAYLERISKTSNLSKASSILFAVKPSASNQETTQSSATVDNTNTKKNNAQLKPSL